MYKLMYSIHHGSTILPLIYVAKVDHFLVSQIQKLGILHGSHIICMALLTLKAIAASVLPDEVDAEKNAAARSNAVADEDGNKTRRVRGFLALEE